MRFYNYLKEEVSDSEISDLINRWKSKLKPYGITNVNMSVHGFKRMNHKRNNPPIAIEDLDWVLDGFLRKMGSSFKKDIVDVKNHVAKPRGIDKKRIPYNNLEFAVKSVKTNVVLVFVLKQDFNKKGTAMVLPMTMQRKKGYNISKGQEVVVERREIWI